MDIMDKLVRVIRKIRFEVKCKKADRIYQEMYPFAWSMYPPSFYMRHTPEEIKAIKQRDRAELMALLKDLDDE